VRREKRQGLVPPIVTEARRTVLLVEGKDGEQLDRADAEISQVRDLLDQPGVGTALGRSDAGARMPGEPAAMHFVDDRLGKRPAERCVSFPVIGVGVNDHALQCRRRVVPGSPRRLPAASRRPGNAFSVGVEQKLVRVETQPSCRIEGAGNAVAIELTRGDARHECVPIVVGAIDPRVEIDYSKRFGVV
jgi:hypothetical protein